MKKAALVTGHPPAPQARQVLTRLSVPAEHASVRPSWPSGRQPEVSTSRKHRIRRYLGSVCACQRSLRRGIVP